MSNHYWVQNNLCDAWTDEKGTFHPEVKSPFLTCKHCGTQHGQIGWGAKAQLVYRKDSAHEWTFVKTECISG